MNPLHEADMIRRRKNKVGDCIHEAYSQISEIGWIHPNGDPVYLDYDQRRLLEGMQKRIGELLERHEEAEEGLKDAARRVA